MKAGTITRLFAFALASAALSGSSPTRAAEEPSMELGFLVGAELSDADLAGQAGDRFGSWGSVAGARFAHRLGSSSLWFLDGTTSHTPTNLALGRAEVNVLRGGIELLFDPHPFRWFVQGSGGWADVDYRANLDFDRPMVSFGFGQRRRFARDGFFHWEVRADRLLGSDGLGGREVANGQFLLGWSVGIGGPPADTDGDGVPDRSDRCPGTPRGASVDAAGCPRDSDGDKVLDGIDQCPDTPPGARVDAVGCPTDSDGDGVPDGIDRCPDTPTGAIVDSGGCPKDEDGDGVPDGIDRCPDTPRGAKVDAAGCPIAEEKPKAAPIFVGETKRLVLEGVHFAHDSAVLAPDSLTILDRVAESLGDWPEVRVEIGGHTDSTGSDAYNRALSRRRAEAVRDYLVRRGIEASRLTVKGYGEGAPVADNATKAGRTKNRRVELKRTN